MNAEEAMILVSTLPMLGDNKRIIRTARKLNPHLHIIIRSRFVRDMKELFDLGADEVIPEEFETSVEIFTRVLTKYMIPHDEIEKLVATIRDDGYSMFRSLSTTSGVDTTLALKLPQVEIHSVHVCQNATAIGRSVSSMGISDIEGLTLLAVSREGRIDSNPGPEYVLHENDILFFLGRISKLNEIMDIFREQDAENCETKE